MSAEGRPLLSFCIPTHNRAALLAQLLENIKAQCNGQIEVVIVDGGSTDETESVVRAYEAAGGRSRYFRRERRCGIDIDVDKSVDLASSDYCWLMSDDDGLAPGSVNSMMAALKSGCDLYICNRTVCDSQLAPIRDRAWLRSGVGGSVFRLADREQMETYLRHAQEFGAVFSYLSALVVRRDMWRSHPYRQEFDRSGYAHVARIFDMIRAGARLQYVEAPLVLNRSFNDSFLEAGVVRRFMIDIDGFMRIAEMQFGDDPEMRVKLLRVMMLEHPWHQLVKVRACVSSSAEWQDIGEKLLRCGCSGLALAAAGALGSRTALVKATVGVRARYNQAAFHRQLYKMRSRLAYGGGRRPE